MSAVADIRALVDADLALAGSDVFPLGLALAAALDGDDLRFAAVQEQRQFGFLRQIRFDRSLDLELAGVARAFLSPKGREP